MKKENRIFDYIFYILRMSTSLLLMVIFIFFATNSEVSALQDSIAFRKDIHFEYESLKYEYTLQELGFNRIGKCEGTDFTNDLIRCEDPELLYKKMLCLSREISIDAVDASLYIDEEGKLRIKPAQEGYILDIEKLVNDLSSTSQYCEKYLLPVYKQQPAITTEELLSKYPQYLWAQYSTTLANIPDRTENVRLSSKELDSLLIKPGEVISFNETVGPRLMERGYRKAKIIINGKFEYGLGGGVCQVSSTLYNLLLLSGLEITERHSHSVRINYVPLGRDATVVYGKKDLVFLNNTESYLLLKTSLTGLELTMSLYGNVDSAKQDVNIYTKILRIIPYTEVEVIDDSLPRETSELLNRGQNGYITETYRVFKNGISSVEELVSKDYYQTIPSRTAIGLP
jgi:vancomycin resistance protein YoaR